MSIRKTGRTYSRRGFLQRSASGIAGAVAFPYIVPGRALGLDGTTAPSNRIVIGCIGVGSQGTGNLKSFLPSKDVQVVAVCDVDKAHRDEAAAIINKTYDNNDCATYNDFRDLILRGDLDALSIAVPDHWHAIPAIEGAKNGLHMYAEKPLSLTIEQGRAMVDAVQRYGVTWQTGSWQRSVENFHHACELVRNGRIGEVHTVEVGLPTGRPNDPQPEMPVPEGFDYDRWLGPAPWAPYTKDRCHWNFRWILDYSGGQLTDWAAHHIDIANWGMGTEYTGPIEVVPVEWEFPRDGLWNAATQYKFYAKYPPGASPLAPKGFTMWVMNDEKTDFGMGTKFIGTEGTVWVTRGDERTEPKNLWKTAIKDDGIKLPRSRNHFRNFIECVRSGEQTITPIEPAHRAITVAHLGNIAMQLERNIRWNPETESIVADTQATRMLGRAMRGNWHI